MEAEHADQIAALTATGRKEAAKEVLVAVNESLIKHNMCWLGVAARAPQCRGEDACT